MTSSKRRELTRSLITEASASVFATKGFHGATMDEIARQAGYSPAALYKYFRNKEEIFVDLLELLRESTLECFDLQVPASLSFEQRLRLLIARKAQFGVKHRELFRASFLHLHCPTETSAKLRQTFIRNHNAYLEAIREFMQKGIDDGELRNIDALDAATALVGLIHAFAARWLMSDEPYPVESRLDLLVEIFMRGTAVAQSQA